MTDFRALCAELADELDAETGYTRNDGVRITNPVVSEARAALAEGAGVGVTDEELDGFAVQWWAGFAHLERGADAATPITSIVAIRHFSNFLRDALARYGTHPRPIPPLDATRQLILRLTAELARLHDSDPPTLDLIAEARAFIDAGHPRPIPVDERLPTAADLSDEGTVCFSCWWLCNRSGEHEWHRLPLMTAGACRYHGYTHWLPAAAIPLPEGE